MTTEPHFTGEHRVELTRVFTELTDFIHDGSFEQVLGCGSSAYPYAAALERAYRNRYGKSIKLINLGPLRQHFRDIFINAWAQRRSVEKRNAVLKIFSDKRPSFDKTKKTLLFDELIAFGRTFSTMSAALDVIGTPHANGVILALNGAPPELVHYSGIKNRDDWFEKIYLARSGKFYEAGRFRKPSAAQRAFLDKVRRELREIADSVPRKEQAQMERK